MTPGQLLYSLLIADPAVAALVDGRVYPLRIKQAAALPAITYQQVGGTNERCSSYGRFRYQLSAHALSYAGVCDLTAAIEQALSGYEDGEILIESDAPAIDHFAEESEAFFRTQDFFIDFPNPQTVPA